MSSIEEPYVSREGWKKMKLPGWEYKNCGLGQYMRYNKRGKPTYKHNVVFFHFGDPSYAEVDEWLKILERSTAVWPNVEVVRKVQDNKRRRLEATDCQRCGTFITSLYELQNMVDKTCKECQNALVKEKREAEREKQNIIKQKQLCMKQLEDALRDIKEKEALIEQNEVLSRQLQHRLGKMESTVEVKNDKIDHLERKVVEMERQIVADMEEAQIQYLRATVQNCKLCIKTYTSSILDKQMRLMQELNKQYETAKALHDKYVNLKQSINKNVYQQQQQIYLLNDILNGTFAKSLVVDLYYVGILKLCSKPRGDGNISERIGNIRPFNIKMRPTIEKILGLEIPIVIAPDNLPLGIDVPFYKLQMLFDLHGLNFQYALRDIVVKNARGIYISVKTNRKLLLPLARAVWDEECK